MPEDMYTVDLDVISLFIFEVHGRAGNSILFLSLSFHRSQLQFFNTFFFTVWFFPGAVKRVEKNPVKSEVFLTDAPQILQDLIYAPASVLVFLSCVSFPSCSF